MKGVVDFVGELLPATGIGVLRAHTAAPRQGPSISSRCTKSEMFLNANLPAAETQVLQNVVRGSGSK